MTLTSIQRIFLSESNELSWPRFLQDRRISSTGKMVEHLGEEHPWYTYFAGDLFNTEAHQAKANLFLNSLQYDAITKGIKIIIIPITNFGYIDFEDKDKISLCKTSFSLMQVTKKQMESKLNLKGHWFDHPSAIDYDHSQANHLTPRNNEILANKVIRHIKTNEPINLTTEWEYT